MAKKQFMMRIVRASQGDNDRLCQFFNASILPGDVDIRLERANFFLPYQLQSDDYATYLLLNDEDQIEAMASLVFRQGVLGGKAQTIGYATDLRVSNSRRAILTWAQHFVPLLEAEKAARSCQYVFTVVAQMQKQAYNAFIRPRLTRRSLPRYHLFRSFKIVTVHGIWPFAPRSLDTIFLRQGTNSDLSLVAEYLARQHRQTVLHFNPQPEDVINSLARWPQLKMENFILAFDFHRQLVGCVAPWNPSHLQKTFATQYHHRTKVLHDSLKMLSFLKLTRTLPEKNKEFNFQYLTHFYADNPDIFYSLLRAAFHASPAQFVVYPQFDGDLAFTPPRTFMTAHLKAGLYCIQDPRELSPQFLNWSRMAPPPEFELSFM